MAISEEVVVELASVVVDDDFRVELTMLGPVMDFAPAQAEALARELELAAVEARRLLAAHLEDAEMRQLDAQPRAATGEAVL